jgi:hypothetical protein
MVSTDGREEVYDQIRGGHMSLAEFLDWIKQREVDGYSTGYNHGYETGHVDGTALANVFYPGAD